MEIDEGLILSKKEALQDQVESSVKPVAQKAKLVKPLFLHRKNKAVVWNSKLLSSTQDKLEFYLLGNFQAAMINTTSNLINCSHMKAHIKDYSEQATSFHRFQTAQNRKAKPVLIVLDLGGSDINPFRLHSCCKSYKPETAASREAESIIAAYRQFQDEIYAVNSGVLIIAEPVIFQKAFYHYLCKNKCFDMLQEKIRIATTNCCSDLRLPDIVEHFMSPSRRQGKLPPLRELKRQAAYSNYAFQDNRMLSAVAYHKYRNILHNFVQRLEISEKPLSPKIRKKPAQKRASKQAMEVAESLAKVIQISQEANILADNNNLTTI